MSLSEAYENGLSTLDNSTITNAATLKLGSTGTGLWIIGSNKDLFAGHNKNLQKGSFVHEFFDETQNAYAFNEAFLECSKRGITAGAFAKRTFIEAVGCHPVTSSRQNFELTGKITLNAEFENGKIVKLCKIPSLQVFNDASTRDFDFPVTTDVTVKMTMNDADLMRFVGKQWDPSSLSMAHIDPTTGLIEVQSTTVKDNSRRWTRGLSLKF